MRREIAASGLRRSIETQDDTQFSLAEYLGALSVYAALTASFINLSADTDVLTHDQYVHDMMDTRVLAACMWTYTRHMIAYGATKGAVHRTELHSCAQGWCNVSQVMDI